MTHMLLAFFLLISACSSSQTKDINARMDATIRLRQNIDCVFVPDKQYESNSRNHS